MYTFYVYTLSKDSTLNSSICTRTRPCPALSTQLISHFLGMCILVTPSSSISGILCGCALPFECTHASWQQVLVSERTSVRLAEHPAACLQLCTSEQYPPSVVAVIMHPSSRPALHRGGGTRPLNQAPRRNTLRPELRIIISAPQCRYQSKLCNQSSFRSWVTNSVGRRGGRLHGTREWTVNFDLQVTLYQSLIEPPVTTR